MNFVLIVGPPAVGKMTVGQCLAKRLDYRLFHNHMSIEFTLKFFDWGDEGFKEINEGIRQLVFNTCVQSKTLNGLIFTLVWAFDEEEDWAYVRDIRKRYEEQGWNFYVLELTAGLEERLERNRTENRLHYKQSKRNLEKSHKNILKLEDTYKMNSSNKLTEFNHLKVDNTDLDPEKVVEKFIEYMNLK